MSNGKLIMEKFVSWQISPTDDKTGKIEYVELDEVQVLQAMKLIYKTLCDKDVLCKMSYEGIKFPTEETEEQPTTNEEPKKQKKEEETNDPTAE